MRKRYRVAGLTGGAGVAVRIASVISVFSAMARAVSVRSSSVRRRIFMVKMGCFHDCMGMSRYAFCSNLHLPSRHSGRHRITGPATQRQQGDHDDEEQAVHGVIREKVT